MAKKGSGLISKSLLLKTKKQKFVRNKEFQLHLSSPFEASCNFYVKSSLKAIYPRFESFKRIDNERQNFFSEEILNSFNLKLTSEVKSNYKMMRDIQIHLNKVMVN